MPNLNKGERVTDKGFSKDFYCLPLVAKRRIRQKINITKWCDREHVDGRWLINIMIRSILIDNNKIKLFWFFEKNILYAFYYKPLQLSECLDLPEVCLELLINKLNIYFKLTFNFFQSLKNKLSAIHNSNWNHKMEYELGLKCLTLNFSDK